MSEEQKYYTPAKEDFRIGFKYEFKSSISGDWIPLTVEEEEYEEDNLNICKIIDLNMFELPLRVPYLTAEQIEAEGWARRDDNEFTISINSLCEYVLSFEPQFSDNIRIRKDVMDQTVYLFFGKCRCKNDLRLICKMLGIETTKS